MKEIHDLAVKVFGMTDDEAQSLFEKTDEGEVLKSDALDILRNRDKERIRRIKEEFKTEATNKFNDGYSKAKKEERSGFETEIREAFQLGSQSTGVDLIKDLLAQKSQKEDIKTHPDYIQLERKMQNEFVPKKDFETVKTEYETFKGGVERKEKLSRVKADARAIFRELNPVLSKDQRKAMNQENDFLAKFETFDYQIQEDGNHVVLKDGKRLENENMNPVAFGEMVKQKTLEYFDLRDQEPRGGAGQEPPARGGSGYTFKAREDFYAEYNKEADPQKRIAMTGAAKKAGLI